jgi:hypothetical protein
MHLYDRTYYEYITSGSIRSAESVLPVVSRYFTIASVADFGAGRGAWLSVWRALGVDDVLAVDGHYVEPQTLLVDPARFVAADLTRPVRLGRTFDLVQSLEVAEHLPESAAGTLVDTLVGHGSLVLFSAAAPGQGGEHHVNERPYAYWQALFAARGFAMLDVIRPAVRDNHAVERWYRYNCFLFIKNSCLPSLPAHIRRQQIPFGARIPDVSPWGYRLRKLAIRNLPVQAATQLAVMKKHWYAGITSAGGND